MELFESVIGDIRTFVASARTRGLVRETDYSSVFSWPAGKKGGIVMQADTAVELGSPREDSVAFLAWTNNTDLVRNGRIALVGPDLCESVGKSLPFGKVVLLGVRDFVEDNCYERHRDIELLRYDMNLSGYMMRAASQYGREWSRVGREAVENGFSLNTLGGSLIRMYKTRPEIASAEVLFVTSSTYDVRSLAVHGDRVQKLIGAMNKMATEPAIDCDNCDYTDICKEVEGLRSMRKALGKDGPHA